MSGLNYSIDELRMRVSSLSFSDGEFDGDYHLNPDMRTAILDGARREHPASPRQEGKQLGPRHRGTLLSAQGRRRVDRDVSLIAAGHNQNDV